MAEVKGLFLILLVLVHLRTAEDGDAKQEKHGDHDDDDRVNRLLIVDAQVAAWWLVDADSVLILTANGKAVLVFFT